METQSLNRPRLENPAALLPEATPALQALYKSTYGSGVSPTILAITHLRVSQINGCGACIDGGVKGMKSAGETDERLAGVAAWRDLPYFTDAERAALALAESMTRLADRSDAVSDEVWNEAARHYDERALAGLVLAIATTNLFNRVNVTTRQGPQRW